MSLRQSLTAADTHELPSEIGSASVTPSTYLLKVTCIAVDLLQGGILGNDSCNMSQIALSTGEVIILGPYHQASHHHNVDCCSSSRHMIC